jgi:arsenate reductase
MMTQPPVLYHNPRCSKSRQTLKLLNEAGHEPRVVEYLKQGLAELEIRDLARARHCSLHDLLRIKEKAYAEHQLSSESSDAQIIEALLDAPELLERPIVITDKGARLGRPPEDVLEILS